MKKRLRVGINGFGRIGRIVARILLEQREHDLVHINDLNPDSANLAYLLKYDSTYGRLPDVIAAESKGIRIDENWVSVSHQEAIDAVDWKTNGVDVVIEATGVKQNEELSRNLTKKGISVIVTNSSSIADFILLFGVNESKFRPQEHKLLCTSICDVNACAPVLNVLDRAFGVAGGFITSLHPWLSYQNLMDGSSRSQSYPGQVYSHYPLGRSSIGTLIPKPTTLVSALEKVMPHLSGRLQCLSYRVPTQTVTSADMTIEFSRDVTEKQILEAMDVALQDKNLRRVLRVSDEPLISVDYQADPHSVIFDTRWLMVNRGRLVKLVLWYDNEWGYSSRVADAIDLIAQNET